MTTIYGIDSNQAITPTQVRDALIECFYQAHCQQTGIENVQDSDSLNRTYCQQLVKKAFHNTNGDFDNPTKEHLIQVMENLAKFSSTLRDPQIIQEHTAQIQQLINALP
jgi:hypothetical protein